MAVLWVLSLGPSSSCLLSLGTNSFSVLARHFFFSTRLPQPGGGHGLPPNNYLFAYLQGRRGRGASDRGQNQLLFFIFDKVIKGHSDWLIPTEWLRTDGCEFTASLAAVRTGPDYHSEQAAEEAGGGGGLGGVGDFSPRPFLLFN